MSELVDKYIQLEQKMDKVRAEHGGRDSAEEDALLDEMDIVWWAMSPEEQSEVTNGRVFVF